MSHYDTFKEMIREGKTPKNQLLDMLEEIKKRNMTMKNVVNEDEYVITSEEYNKIKGLILSMPE